MTPIQIHLIIIPLLPLIAAVFTAALGPKFLKANSHIPTLGALIGSCLLSLILVTEVWDEAAAEREAGVMVGWETTVDLWNWVHVPQASADTHATTRPDGPFDLDIAVTLRADTLTAMMLGMVTFVSLLVAIYSAGYMRGDRGYWRFFTYFSLFVFSMTMLVSVSNFVMLYVFWEAVGMCSYLLIGFWFEKPEAAAAGKKAFLVNRVGDFGFALAVFLIWTTYGSLNFHDTPGTTGVLGQTMLTHPDRYVGDTVGLAICLLLMLGACGKSAQFPLHVWLPDAMEGPTPVSALIHAATMVTAGVYMVTRCTPLFMASEQAAVVVASIGGLTALIAGIIAFTQTDLKRVLAYSTISQLGYMFLGLGTGTLAGITAGMFHLFTHAFFKALLFLGAGSVMHAMGGVIDIRRFGGLRRLMPITHGTFLVGCLALAGVPPFAGFFSKDAIIAAVQEQAGHSETYRYLGYSAYFTAMLTAMYMFRAFFLTFYGKEQIPREAGSHAHESPRTMTGPLLVLAACAILVGGLAGPFMDYLSMTPSLAYGPLAETIPHEGHAGSHATVAIVSTVIALLGIALAAFLYLGDTSEVRWITSLVRPLYWLSYGKFFFDPIYTVLIVWPCLGLAELSYWLDRHLVDGAVNLVGRIPPTLGTGLRNLQTGMLQLYAMLMVLGLLVLIGALFL